MAGFSMPGYAGVEVHEDRSVTFTFNAPNAREVAVTGIKGQPATPLTKSGDQWSVTVGPLDPDIYEYAFQVDGASVLDPMNREVKEWIVSANAFLVRGTPPRNWERQDVPHGSVSHHLYPSKTLGTDRPAIVYTPPGYETSGAAAYPVLYLLHGFGDGVGGWYENGKVNLILDNLIAAGKIRPMIVVMPYGHPVPIPNAPRNDPAWANYGDDNSSTYWQDISTDLMPYVAKQFRIKTGPSHTAIAGLSMGGGHAFEFGMLNLDIFGWVGLFSNGLSSRQEFAQFEPLAQDAKATNEKLHLLWIGCGREDFLHERAVTLHNWLKDKGIEHIYRESDDAHDWRSWRRYIAEFTPLLFGGKE